MATVQSLFEIDKIIKEWHLSHGMEPVIEVEKKILNALRAAPTPQDGPENVRPTSASPKSCAKCNHSVDGEPFYFDESGECDECVHADRLTDNFEPRTASGEPGAL